MFAVLSFDFNGSLAVRVHGVLASETGARELYKSLVERHGNELPGEYVSMDGHTLFWGPEAAGGPRTPATPWLKRIAAAGSYRAQR